MRKFLLFLVSFVFFVVTTAGAMAVSYTGNSYDVNSQDGTPNGLFYDDGYFYVAGDGNNKVFQYYPNWTYTTNSYNIIIESQVTDITYDENYYYVIGQATKSLYRYYKNWSYTGETYNFSTHDNFPKDIVFLNGYWYMIGQSTDKVYKYDSDFNLLSNYSVISQVWDGASIETDGQYFYIISSSTVTAYKYDLDFNYLSETIDFSTNASDGSGMELFNNYWYISDITENKIHQYTSDCSIPTEDTTYIKSRVLCGSQYNLNDTNQNGAITINSSNIIIDGNGSKIYGSYQNDTEGLRVRGNNITIKNFILEGYDACLLLTNYGFTSSIMENSTIYNNTFIRCDGLSGVFTDGQQSFNISHNNFYNFSDSFGDSIGSHAIYISGYNTVNSAQNGDIHDNTIYNMSASGIKINAQDTIRNLKIYNNNISKLTQTQGDDIGVHIADATNISVYNNDFIGWYDTGIVFNVGANASHYAHDNKIYENRFSGLALGIWAKDGTYNNLIYNNNYSSLNAEVRTLINSSLTIEEDDGLKFSRKYGNYTLLMNFTGDKNVSIDEDVFEIYDLLSPNNSLYNWSSSSFVAHGLSDYNLTLETNGRYMITSYTAPSTPTTSSTQCEEAKANSAEALTTITSYLPTLALIFIAGIIILFITIAFKGGNYDLTIILTVIMVLIIIGIAATVGLTVINEGTCS